MGLVWKTSSLEEKLPHSRQIAFVLRMGAMCTEQKRNVFPMNTTELACGKWNSSGVQGFILGALSVTFYWNWNFRLKATVVVSWQHSKANVNLDQFVHRCVRSYLEGSKCLMNSWTNLNWALS